MTLYGSFSRVGRGGVDMEGLLSDREAAIDYRKRGGCGGLGSGCGLP